MEEWLDSSELVHLSRGTKAKIRNIMRAIYLRSIVERANGEDIATQAELLRNSQRVALEHYTQAIPESKRAAQDRVLMQIFGKDSANGTFRHMAESPND